MERYEESAKKAKQALAVGEHLFKVTYPIVKESKLLLATLEQVHNSHIAILTSVLIYERERKTIPPFHANFESMCTALELRLAKKYSPEHLELNLIKTVDQTLKFHKEAAVTFTRKGDLILAADDYVIQKITPDFVADVLKKTQAIITKWTGLLNDALRS